MPKPKAGHSQVNLLVPDRVLAAWKAAADRAGRSLTAWIAATCAKRAGVEYAPPARGRPKESAGK